MISSSKFDWKREATTRERVLFGVIFVMCFLMAVKAWWIPLQMKIHNFKAERAVVKLQIDAQQRLIDAMRQQMAGHSKQGSVTNQSEEAQRVRNVIDKISSVPAEDIARTTHLLSGRQILGGLAFRGVQKGEYKPADAYAIVPLTVSVEGMFNGIKRYLKKIEGVELPLLVQSVNLKREQKKPGIVSGAFVVNLFIHMPSGVLAGGAGAEKVAVGQKAGGVPKAKR